MSQRKPTITANKPLRTSQMYAWHKVRHLPVAWKGTDTEGKEVVFRGFLLREGLRDAKGDTTGYVVAVTHGNYPGKHHTLRQEEVEDAFRLYDKTVADELPKAALEFGKMLLAVRNENHRDPVVARRHCLSLLGFKVPPDTVPSFSIVGVTRFPCEEGTEGATQDGDTWFRTITDDDIVPVYDGQRYVVMLSLAAHAAVRQIAVSANVVGGPKDNPGCYGTFDEFVKGRKK